MADVLSWISSTAFPALGSCWDFFKKCIVDLISYVTSSRLVFIFALFLIGTIISVIVFIVTSAPDVSDVDSSYPDFKTIKQRDLYFSGFSRPFSLKLFTKLNAFFQRRKRQKENDVIRVLKRVEIKNYNSRILWNSNECRRVMLVDRPLLAKKVT